MKSTETSDTWTLNCKIVGLLQSPVWLEFVKHHFGIITDSVVLWKIQKFDWLIPETKWHSCLHNRALCSYLATLRLLRQRENNPQFSGHASIAMSVIISFECKFWSCYALLCIVTRLISDVHFHITGQKN